MAKTARGILITIAVLLVVTVVWPADKKSELRYKVGPRPLITVTNSIGPVVVSRGPGGQVLITATTHSDKAEVEPSQNGNRVALRTRLLQAADENDARVDYQLQVPADATLTIRCLAGPVRIEGLQGNLSIQGETAPVELRGLNNAHIQVHTASGAVSLSRISAAYVDLTSIGVAVTLDNVNGPVVTVNTSNGAINYTGDLGAGGTYTFTSHTGNISLVLPASASVDLSARSINGSVQNDFPLQPKTRAGFASARGSSVAGLANAGASSVRINSLSGTITVKKQ